MGANGVARRGQRREGAAAVSLLGAGPVEVRPDFLSRSGRFHCAVLVGAARVPLVRHVQPDPGAEEGVSDLDHRLRTAVHDGPVEEMVRRARRIAHRVGGVGAVGHRQHLRPEHGVSALPCAPDHELDTAPIGGDVLLRRTAREREPAVARQHAGLELLPRHLGMQPGVQRFQHRHPVVLQHGEKEAR